VGVEQFFNVATEFRFDIGEAMINTKLIQGNVDKISESADNAMKSLDYLAGGLVAHLGLGSGGLLGMLSKAVQLSEEFMHGSIGFVNSISSNYQTLTGHVHGFNEQLETSHMLMDKIGSVADGLGLSGAALAQITQTVATPLANRGKLGDDYENGIKMATNIMLASEITGMNSGMMAESILRSLNPGQGFSGKPFEHLMGTQAFREAHITRSGQGSGMAEDKKIDLLTKALEQLGSNAEFLAARAQMLSVQFQIMKNHVEAVLKPIGDAFEKPLAMLFGQANDWLAKNGTRLGKSLSAFITSFIADPEKLIINLMQAKSFSSDFKIAARLSIFISTMVWLGEQAAKIGITFNGGLIKYLFDSIYEGLTILFSWVWRVGLIGRTFALIGSTIMSILPNLLVFLGIFQTISRAKAIADVEDVKAIPDLSIKFSEQMVRLKNVMGEMLEPLALMQDGLARDIAPLFSWANWLHYGAIALEFIVDCMEDFTETLNTWGAELFALANAFDLTHLADGFEGFGDVFTETLDEQIKQIKQRRLEQDQNKGTTSNPHVTNNLHVEARFDMREQLEPDRIAFAVTTHLKKLAIGAIGGRGNTVVGGLVAASQSGSK
jgi:hypothetical protein